MEMMQKLLCRPIFQRAAAVLHRACYFIMLYFALCLLLAGLGRQVFILRTDTDIRWTMLGAQAGEDVTQSGFTIHPEDEIQIVVDAEGRVGPAVRIGMISLTALDTLPMIAAYWFLSRVLGDLGNGKGLTRCNASRLISYGLLYLFEGLLVPWLKRAVCTLVNFASAESMSVAITPMRLDSLILGLAALLLAAVFWYGERGQREMAFLQSKDTG